MAKSSPVPSAVRAASITASVGASSVSSAASSASVKASAVAAETYNQTSTAAIVFTTTVIVITSIVGLLAAVYFSGYADDILLAWAKKFYSAKGKAETMALVNAGSEKAEGYLQDQLKKNPVMGEHELEQVQTGLGKEASADGLGGVSSKLGGLGDL